MFLDFIDFPPFDGSDGDLDMDMDDTSSDYTDDDPAGYDIDDITGEVISGSGDDESSVNDMLSSGISADKVSDEEYSEVLSTDSHKKKLDQTPFIGHTSCKCNLCSCTFFRPTSDNPKYCVCGHHDFDHEWKP